VQKQDTLDLTRHAELSLSYLTRMTDPKLGYLPYWRVNLEADPPEASHTRVDGSELPGSWVDAIILARQMTGSRQGEEAEAGLKEMLLSDYGDDGLHYHVTFPWCPARIANIHEQGYVLNGLVTCWLATEDPRVKQRIEGLIDGLLKIAACIERGYVYEPSKERRKSYYFPSDGITPDGYDFTLSAGRGKEHIFNGVVILPLVMYYEATGYEPACDLAEGLVDHIVSESREFGYDGRFIGHFHATMWVIGGILKYALLARDRRLIEMTRRVYEWAKQQGSSFGWFPEWVGTRPPRDERCEICCVADMVCLARLLAESVDDGYWEDVERFTRNHLVEGQVQSLPEREVRAQKDDTLQATYQDVRERAIGGYAAYSTPNDLAVSDRRIIGGCCGATGMRALFLAWDAIAQKRDGTVWINMALNRRTPWVDIESCHPYEGRLELVIHDAPKLRVRVPTWAGRRVTVSIDGTARPAEWEGNYLKLDGLERGQTAAITHPLSETTHTETIAEQEFTLCWRGATLVRISPEGSAVPLYQREHMRQSPD